MTEKMPKKTRLILLLTVLCSATVTVWFARGWMWRWLLRMHGVH